MSSSGSKQPVFPGFCANNFYRKCPAAQFHYRRSKTARRKARKIAANPLFPDIPAECQQIGARLFFFSAGFGMLG